MSLSRKLKLGYYAARYLGPRFVTLRLGLYFDKLTGKTRRLFVPRPWDQLDLAQLCAPGAPVLDEEYAAFKRSQPIHFLFPLGQPPALGEAITSAPSQRSPDWQQRLALLREDRCVYFFNQPSPEKIDWHRNPIDDVASDPSRPWHEIPDYLPGQGDPRMLWEPSRAAWALDLARARARGMDADDLAALYWRWVDSWMDGSPPFMGFQWKCGQESAVRLMAVLLGGWALADREAFSGYRWQQLARLAWATGYRIEHHINYAISQKNNHAISEAAGLMLIAHLFPELRDASRWQQIGRRVLEQELHRQVYADGSYCQQSTNYQRVMMQGVLLAMRLAELQEQPFAKPVYETMQRCVAFMHQLTDDTGRVPQYGNNDGAWILPLDECDFWDFRPMLQSLHYLLYRKRLYGPGPWDEDTLWLFGPEALQTEHEPVSRCSSCFDSGGYHTLRDKTSWAMIRCHSYRDRVAHSDPLTVDLWRHGVNLLRDCGTFQYYIPGQPELEEHFSSIAAHNSLRLDQRDPMPRFSRFQRFPFTRAKLLHFEPDAEQPWLVSEFYGYQRRPWHVLWRRCLVCLGEGDWLIVDDLYGDGEHQAAWFWHLPDVAVTLEQNSATIPIEGQPVYLCSGATVPARARLDQQPVSPHYGAMHAGPVVELALRGPLPLRCVTLLSGERAISVEPASSPTQADRWLAHFAGRQAAITLAALDPSLTRVWGQWRLLNTSAAD